MPEKVNWVGEPGRVRLDREGREERGAGGAGGSPLVSGAMAMRRPRASCPDALERLGGQRRLHHRHDAHVIDGRVESAGTAEPAS